MIRRINENIDDDFIIVYHGTDSKFINKIKNEGLKSVNYHDASWYMVSEDKRSAIYHAVYDEDSNRFPYLVTLKIPVTNERWEGDPYLWKPYVRSNESKWFGLKQLIPSEFIAKVEQIDIDIWRRIKSEGY